MFSIQYVIEKGNTYTRNVFKILFVEQVDSYTYFILRSFNLLLDDKSLGLNEDERISSFPVMDPIINFNVIPICWLVVMILGTYAAVLNSRFKNKDESLQFFC